MYQILPIAVMAICLFAGISDQALWAQTEQTIQVSSPELELLITGEDPGFSYDWTTVQLET
jgi:lipopolysaccharide export system protein LptA